jgi:hypothetical protein
MEPFPICIEGRNCWRIAQANRAAFLIDGDAYFSALASTLQRARRYIDQFTDPRKQTKPLSLIGATGG